MTARTPAARPRPTSALEVLWIPLGAGAHVVRASGRAYESIAAHLQGRSRRELYHSALTGVLDGACFVIEMAPVPDGHGRASRGVVAEGPVGCRLAGRLRLFRYEVRRWPGGEISDLASAVGDPVRLTDDAGLVRAALALVPSVPTATWGRDELHAGEMWNSNSVVAWIVTRLGLEEVAGGPPPGGRAPGWRAGAVVARRQLRHSAVHAGVTT